MTAASHPLLLFGKGLRELFLENTQVRLRLLRRDARLRPPGHEKPIAGPISQQVHARGKSGVAS